MDTYRLPEIDRYIRSLCEGDGYKGAYLRDIGTYIDNLREIDILGAYVREIGT